MRFLCVLVSLWQNAFVVEIFWMSYVLDRSIFLSIVSSSIAEGSSAEKGIPVSFRYTKTAFFTGICG